MRELQYIERSPTIGTSDDTRVDTAAWLRRPSNRGESLKFGEQGPIASPPPLSQFVTVELDGRSSRGALLLTVERNSAYASFVYRRERRDDQGTFYSAVPAGTTGLIDPNARCTENNRRARYDSLAREAGGINNELEP